MNDIPVVSYSRNSTSPESILMIMIAVLVVTAFPLTRPIGIYALITIPIGLIVASFVGVVWWRKKRLFNKMRDVYYPQYENVVKSLMVRVSNIYITTEQAHCLLAGKAIHPNDYSVFKLEDGTPFNNPKFSIMDFGNSEDE